MSAPGSDLPAYVGSLIEVFDRFDFIWLGVILASRQGSDGRTIYLCDIWRVAEGRLIWRRSDEFNRGEFEVLRTAPGAGGGR